MASSSGFCGDYPTTPFYDGSIYDLTECYRDAVLFGVPCAFILLCGTWHTASAVGTHERRMIDTKLRVVEKIVFALSAVLAVYPWFTLWYHLAEDDIVIAPFIYVSAVLRSLAWLYSIFVFYWEVVRVRYSPGWTMYCFWFIYFIAMISRFRTAIQQARDNSDITMAQSLWFGEFAIVLIIFLVTSFMLRRTLTDDDAKPRKTAMYHGDAARGGGLRSRLKFARASNEADAAARGKKQKKAVGINGYAPIGKPSDAPLVDPLVDTESENGSFDSDDRLESEASGVRPVNLEEDASLISMLTYNWVSPVFTAGYARQLKFMDFQELMFSDKSSYLSKIYSESWAKQTARVKTKGGPEAAPNMWTLARAVFSPFAKEFWIAGVLKLLSDLLQFVSPQVLSLLILFTVNPLEPEWHGYAYAAMMFLAAAVQTVVVNQYFHRVMRIGVQIKSSLVPSVYQKALRLTQSARQEKTIGEIVNLMSTDTQRLCDTMQYLHMVWSCPLQIGLAVYFLWQEVDVASIIGLGVMLVAMIPTNAFVASRIHKIQKELMRIKDRRIKVTNETLSSMKVIKLYSWEGSFQQKIEGIREEEMHQLTWNVVYYSLMMCLLNSAPVIVSLATFAAYVWLGNDLTAARAFTAVALLNILRMPLTFFPMIINNLVESTVSLKRLVQYFNASELSPPQDDMEEGGENFFSPRHDDTVVKVRDGTFFWDDTREHCALQDIDLDVARGSFSMVIGQTGSGKSALLTALIGDLEQASGKARVNGTVAYASQVAWIQNASLRDNILFGSPFDRRWYNKVIKACALTEDLEILPAGDQTEIGEKGINLSGGQKQRVALARAVYRRADIYFLDDTLSAVDAHVGRHIMQECFVKLLRDKTRLFATNSVAFLDMADHVTVLDEGRITHSGTYEEILAYNLDIVRTREIDEDGDDEQDGGAAKKDGNEVLPAALVRDGASIDLDDLSAEDEAKLLNQKKQAMLRQQSAQSAVSALTDGADEGETEKLKIGGQLIEIEKRERGAVDSKVYWIYARAAGGAWLVFGLLMGLALRQGADVGTSRWLAYWSDHVDDGGEDDTGFFLGILFGLSGGVVLFTIVSMVFFGVGRLKASRSMHNHLIGAILRAPMHFFDTTPIGRILNRFSLDMYALDNTLPFALYQYLNMVFTVATTLGVIIGVTPIFGAVIVPLFVIYWYTQKYYITTSRDLKRWASVLHSPIYSHFAETLDGISTIRAFKVSDRFSNDNEEKVNNWLLAYWPSIAANRWLAIRLELTGIFVVGFASLFAVTQRETISGGLVGLSITYALSITGTLNFLVRMTADRENQIVSVERIKEYTETPSEAPLVYDDSRPDKDWPSKGSMEFRDYAVRYRPELELVLREFNAKIEPREKVGVVGRTGAGKSSLFNAILRVMEPAAGQIIIDGVDITTIGLGDLRSKITIIPQDPVLFTGTVRFNLDPFNTSSDDQMWRALERANLARHVRSLGFNEDSASSSSSDDSDPKAKRSAKSSEPYEAKQGGVRLNTDRGSHSSSSLKEPLVKSLSSDSDDSAEKALGLDYEVSEGGANFSVGQRQLLCMARALLRDSRILLLDEATSAVDVETDRIIQKTIRSAFADCTVLTIAHRLDTIMDSSRVMVLDAGRVIEFDSPAKLLSDPDSAFSSVAKAAFGYEEEQ